MEDIVAEIHFCNFHLVVISYLLELNIRNCTLSLKGDEILDDICSYQAFSGKIALNSHMTLFQILFFLNVVFLCVV